MSAEFKHDKVVLSDDSAYNIEILKGEFFVKYPETKSVYSEYKSQIDYIIELIYGEIKRNKSDGK